MEQHGRGGSTLGPGQMDPGLANTLGPRGTRLPGGWELDDEWQKALERREKALQLAPRQSTLPPPPKVTKSAVVAMKVAIYSLTIILFIVLGILLWIR